MITLCRSSPLTALHALVPPHAFLHAVRPPRVSLPPLCAFSCCSSPLCTLGPLVHCRSPLHPLVCSWTPFVPILHPWPSRAHIVHSWMTFVPLRILTPLRAPARPCASFRTLANGLLLREYIFRKVFYKNSTLGSITMSQKNDVFASL
jgi:hypothetical protein